jgi:hypothetical protein
MPKRTLTKEQLGEYGDFVLQAREELVRREENGRVTKADVQIVAHGILGGRLEQAFLYISQEHPAEDLQHFAAYLKAREQPILENEEGDGKDDDEQEDEYSVDQALLFLKRAKYLLTIGREVWDQMQRFFLSTVADGKAAATLEQFQRVLMTLPPIKGVRDPDVQRSLLDYAGGAPLTPEKLQSVLIRCGFVDHALDPVDKLLVQKKGGRGKRSRLK